MQIDTRIKTSQLKITYPLLLIVFIILILYSLINGWQENLMYIYASSLFLAIYLFLLFLKLYYFYCNDDKNKIVIRFYHSHPFIREYKAIEIPKEFFIGYRIINSFFGLRKDLILKVRAKNGITEYPKISISSLSKKELHSLMETLNKYKKQAN